MPAAGGGYSNAIARAWSSGSILAGKGEKRRSMTSQTSRQTAAEQGQRTPVGTIHVVDPNPLNWLFITWNTMEEPVRTDERAHRGRRDGGLPLGGRDHVRDRRAPRRALPGRRGVRRPQRQAPSTRSSAGRPLTRREPRSTSTRTRPQRSWTTTRCASTSRNRTGWCWASSAGCTCRARASGRRRDLATGSWAPAKATGE
jgi:hypothetical protein